MRSVMEHKFSEVPQANIPRSAFNRTHTHKSTFDCNKLVPFYIDEVLPGDTFVVNATLFARLATPIYPIMDNMYMDTFYFYVPLRILWDNFERFMGWQRDPGDSTDYTIPVCTSTTVSAGCIADYFGIPVGPTMDDVSCLFHRAYFKIWNEWFRDENLQDSIWIGYSTGDGPDNCIGAQLRTRGKRHDYFTSCLPWPQKGDAISLPLGTEADVIYDHNNTNPWRGKKASDGTDATAASARQLDIDAAANMEVTGSYDLQWDPRGNLITDLTTATAATINSIREAFQLQKLMERDARGGTRYIELVKAHFGVTSPDFRVQRPEYLGGNSVPVIITPVQQTSETSGTPQGNLAAYGTVGSTRNGFTKSFTEHGIIIGLVNVRADLTYQQGLHKMFRRSTKYDFYWPALAHLGEQEVLNSEIYFQGTSADDDVFGYQERYAEYRYYPSKITGQMRSNHGTSLDAWHLSQEFGSLPLLDDTFITEATPLDRAIAVPSEPHFVFDSFIECKAVRPMPVYSVPGLIDHF